MGRKVTIVKQRTGKKAEENSVEERIRMKAYELFEKNGKKHGRDIEHWLKAETLVKAGKQGSLK